MNLDEISCPFTWGMEQVVQGSVRLLISTYSNDRRENLRDTENEFPEIMVIFHLILAYERILLKGSASLKKTLKKAEELLEEARILMDAIIKNSLTTESMKVALKHIFIGTKCNVYKKLNRSGDIDMLLSETRSQKHLTKKELAVICGCKSLAWSLYHDHFVENTMLCAITAIEYEPDNGKWHFFFAQAARRQRRKRQSLIIYPNVVEKDAFIKAWHLLKTPLVGVSLAQMYREGGDPHNAAIIYLQVLKLKPTSCKVNLQLALGFIRLHHYKHAKKCLDYVAVRLPNSRTFLHYMAIYHQNCTQDLRTACYFYQRTTERYNYSAEMDYVRCRKKVDRNFDPLAYMFILLKKYENESKNILQEINAAIGTWFLCNRSDIVSACTYYREAVKINPKSTALMMHRLLIPGRRPVNIYEMLLPNLELASQNLLGHHNDEQLALFEEMRELCLLYGPKPKRSQRSTIQGFSLHPNSSSVCMPQTVLRRNTDAPAGRSAGGSRNTDDLIGELSRMGFGHREKHSE